MSNLHPACVQETLASVNRWSAQSPRCAGCWALAVPDSATGARP